MASDFALIDSVCEATGHPSKCTEPATGSVNGSSSSVSVDGVSIGVATSNKLHFDSHAHDHSTIEGCHSMQSHDLDPEDDHSVTLDGDPLLLVGDSTTDPGSGGTAEVVDSGGNSSVSLTE